MSWGEKARRNVKKDLNTNIFCWRDSDRIKYEIRRVWFSDDLMFSADSIQGLFGALNEDREVYCHSHRIIAF